MSFFRLDTAKRLECRIQKPLLVFGQSFELQIFDLNFCPPHQQPHQSCWLDTSVFSFDNFINRQEIKLRSKSCTHWQQVSQCVVCNLPIFTFKMPYLTSSSYDKVPKMIFAITFQVKVQSFKFSKKFLQNLKNVTSDFSLRYFISLFYTNSGKTTFQHLAYSRAPNMAVNP